MGRRPGVSGSGGPAGSKTAWATSGKRPGTRPIHSPSRGAREARGEPALPCSPPSRASSPQPAKLRSNEKTRPVVITKFLQVLRQLARGASTAPKRYPRVRDAKRDGTSRTPRPGKRSSIQPENIGSWPGKPAGEGRVEAGRTAPQAHKNRQPQYSQRPTKLSRASCDPHQERRSVSLFVAWISALDPARSGNPQSSCGRGRGCGAPPTSNCPGPSRRHRRAAHARR